MERLTEKDKALDGYYIGCAEECDCGREDCGSCPEFGRLVRRLGEYEDTGLTPEQCAELAKADKEGCLMVLPCKVGDTVHFAAWFGTNPHIVKRISLPYFYTEDAASAESTADFSLQDFGKTVFLTRKEAEEALRRKWQ